MKGKLYIDGKDAFEEYGVFVERWGYKALIQMPNFKSVTTTEWDEYDGEEPDLIEPMLDSKTFGIQFCLTDILGAGDLYELISDKAYHIFQFSELKKSYKLRLVSNPSLSSFKSLGKVTINFADDFPPYIPDENSEFEPTEYNYPLVDAPFEKAPEKFKQEGYMLDDIDFSRFGVYVIEGTEDAIQKAPNVRENLAIKAKNIPGLKYDDENVFYKAKDVAVKLFIHAQGIEDFWRRWYSFFTVLLKPELRNFYKDTTLEDFDCYYKSNSVTKFDILRNGNVWCEFTVTLRFTSSRPEANYIILATEDNEIVLTEEDEAQIILRV